MRKKSIDLHRFPSAGIRVYLQLNVTFKTTGVCGFRPMEIDRRSSAFIGG
jgi:hypothetical protein